MISLLQKQIKQLSQAILILEDQIAAYEKGVQKMSSCLNINGDDLTSISLFALVSEEITRLGKKN